MAPEKKANKNLPEAMISNVKVIPIIDTNSERHSGIERCYKASFASIKREKLQIVVILPF